GLLPADGGGRSVGRHGTGPEDSDVRRRRVVVTAAICRCRRRRMSLRFNVSAWSLRSLRASEDAATGFARRRPTGLRAPSQLGRDDPQTQAQPLPVDALRAEVAIGLEIGEIPFHRLAQAGREGFLRSPAKLTLYLAGIDCISQVMAGTVRDKGD